MRHASDEEEIPNKCIFFKSLSSAWGSAWHHSFWKNCSDTLIGKLRANMNSDTISGFFNHQSPLQLNNLVFVNLIHKLWEINLRNLIDILIDHFFSSKLIFCFCVQLLLQTKSLYLPDRFCCPFFNPRSSRTCSVRSCRAVPLRVIAYCSLVFRFQISTEKSILTSTNTVFLDVLIMTEVIISGSIEIHKDCISAILLKTFVFCR